MEDLTRRSALKKLGKLAALGAAAPLVAPLGCRGNDGRAILLNVVCHGLFVLNVTDLGLELYSPRVNDHIYKAGSWDKWTVKDLEEGMIYRLQGVKGRDYLPKAEPPEFDVSFSKSKLGFYVHAEYSRFMIELPFPERVRLLRRVDHGPNNPVGSASFELKRFSLCQVLTYRVPDYGQLVLEGLDWAPRIDPKTRTANLHLWAEPASRLSPQHAIHAFEKLSQMIAPLKLKLGTDQTVPLDKFTGVLGVTTEEEQGWSEWVGGGEGSYPTNCMLATGGL